MKTMHLLCRLLFILAAPCLATNAHAFVEYISGNGQTAVIGTLYAKPWVVRVAPFEVVRFGAFGQPMLTFDGAFEASVTADASGLAISPRPRAGPFVGADKGYALGYSSGWIFFDFINLSTVRTGVLIYPWEQSIPVGYQTRRPFEGRVLDPEGNPVAGVPFIFTTDPSCGNFGGAASVSGVTDADGYARARFTGVAASDGCPWSFSAEGAEPAAEQRDILVYALSSVTLAVAPPAAEVIYGQPFAFTLTFTARGIPIQAPPGLSFTVSADHNGATTMEQPPDDWWMRAPIDSNQMDVRSFRGNDMNGNYDITFSVAGGPSVSVPVTQRKKQKGP